MTKRRSLARRVAGFLGVERAIEEEAVTTTMASIDAALKSIGPGAWSELRGLEEGLDLDGGDYFRQQYDVLQATGEPTSKRKNLTKLQDGAARLYRIDPVVANVVRIWTALVVGNGVQVEIDEKKHPTEAALWKAFDRAHGYTRRGGMAWDAALNTFMVGEHFHLFDGDLDAGQLSTVVKALDPINTGGIEAVNVDPQDTSLIVSYKRRGVQGAAAIVPPGQVTFWNLNESRLDLRSAPLIEPVFDDVLRLRQTAISMWAIQEFRLRVSALIYQRGRAGKLGFFRLPKAKLSIFDVPEGGKLDLPDLSRISIGDRMDNSPERTLLSRIAQGVQLPFHIVAQEYREANLASLLAAEGPTAKLADLWKSRFQTFIERDVRHVVGAECEVRVSIPAVIVRDAHEERKSWLGLWEGGLVDHRTALENIDGIDDPDVVLARLAEEKVANMALMGDMNPNQSIGKDKGENEGEGDDDDDEA